MTNIDKNIKSVIDYGCGAGWFLYYFYKDYKIINIQGIEPNDGIKNVIDKKIINNIKFLSLESDLIIKEKYDLAMCIEVIEHIDDKFSNIILNNITKNSNTLIFSAATPGQGGYGHINEREFSYWKNKLENNNNFIFNKPKTKEFRKFLKSEKCCSWYIKNISVFERKK